MGLGDCISGERPWEQREFHMLAFVGGLMCISGLYLQWLVFVYNQDPGRLTLQRLPLRIRFRLYYSLAIYVCTSLCVAFLVSSFTIKKFWEGRGQFNPDHGEFHKIKIFEKYMGMTGLVFVLGATFVVVQKEVRDMMDFSDCRNAAGGSTQFGHGVSNVTGII